MQCVDGSDMNVPLVPFHPNLDPSLPEHLLHLRRNHLHRIPMTSASRIHHIIS